MGSVGSERREQVGHHVVGVQADQKIGEDRQILDVPAAPPASPRKTVALEDLPSSDIVSMSSRNSIQPPTHAPSTGMHVVRTALRRARVAQFGVDHRAVVALLVVLVQDLPVGVHDVFVAPFVTRPLRFVRRDY